MRYDVKQKIKAALIIAGVTFIAIATVFFGVTGQETLGDPRMQAIARVNGEAITKGDFDQKMEEVRNDYRARLGAQYDDRFLEMFGVPAQTLDQLVKYEVMVQHAAERGFRVSDAELRDYVHTLPYFQKEGKFNLELYNSRVGDKLRFQDEQRKRLLVSHFQVYATDRVRLTPEEVRRAYVLRDTKIDLEYAAIDFKELAKKDKGSAAELDAYLKTNPEADLKVFYDKNKKDYTEVASNQIRQIRVGIPFQATPAQKVEAKKKIDAIAKEVTAANFATVAKAKSDDEYAKKGGETGWMTKGSLEPTLEAAIDKLSPGQVSSPVESPYGYYIIQLMKRKDEVVKPLESVKRSVAEKVLAEKRAVEKAEALKKQWNESLKAGKSLDSEFKRTGVEVKKTGPFSVAQGQIPNVGAQDVLLDAVFQLSPKAPVVKELVPLMDKFYYFKVVKLEPAKPADFAKNADVADRASTSTYQGEVMNDWVVSLEKQAKVEKPEMKQNPPPGMPANADG